jgi:hypothetical protein
VDFLSDRVQWDLPVRIRDPNAVDRGWRLPVGLIGPPARAASGAVALAFALQPAQSLRPFLGRQSRQPRQHPLQPLGRELDDSLAHGRRQALERLAKLGGKLCHDLRCPAGRGPVTLGGVWRLPGIAAPGGHPLDVRLPALLGHAGAMLVDASLHVRPLGLAEFRPDPGLQSLGAGRLGSKLAQPGDGRPLGVGKVLAGHRPLWRRLHRGGLGVYPVRGAVARIGPAALGLAPGGAVTFGPLPLVAAAGPLLRWIDAIGELRTQDLAKLAELVGVLTPERRHRLRVLAFDGRKALALLIAEPRALGRLVTGKFLDRAPEDRHGQRLGHAPRRRH